MLRILTFFLGSWSRKKVPFLNMTYISNYCTLDLFAHKKNEWIVCLLDLIFIRNWIRKPIWILMFCYVILGVKESPVNQNCWKQKTKHQLQYNKRENTPLIGGKNVFWLATVLQCSLLIGYSPTVLSSDWLHSYNALFWLATVQYFLLIGYRIL